MENKIITQRLSLECLEKKQISLSVKRLDLTHPQIQGNKWFKLKYHLEEARKQGKKTILTLGGAYSNHLYATAAAGQSYGFQVVMIVRGEQTLPLNPVLQFAKDTNCEIIYWNREKYRRFREENSVLDKEVYGDFYFIPEGGADALGVKGCADILLETDEYEYVLGACGTGTMLVGLVISAKPDSQILGFSALKKGNFLEQEVQNLVEKYDFEENKGKPQKRASFQIITEYDFGGYAKKTAELDNFIADFYAKTQIPLEPIYTGKMLFGVLDLIEKDFFPRNSRLLALHSGGINPMYSR